MKNILLTLLASTITGIGKLGAQTNGPIAYRLEMDGEDVFNALASMVALVIILLFIISMVRQLLDNRIKNKIIDKGISDSQISAILQSNSGDGNYVNLKWAMLLAGLGIGLTIIYYTLPLGIHSLAILCFSIAISFFAYHYLLQKKKKL